MLYHSVHLADRQDLSVAGKRAGMQNTLNGDEETTRSGLFYDSIRIIKEMRENDKRNGRTGIDVRPRIAIWENVPGAFSSNDGDDFRCVLEQLARVEDSGAVIPRLKDEGWKDAGVIVGDNYSICYRLLDAQYFGVAQRRKRVFVVASYGECPDTTDKDYTFRSAGKGCAIQVLSQPDSVFRSLKKSREEGQGVATDSQGCIGTAVEGRLASGKDVCGCLMASGYEKLGAQEMMSGDYTVVEEVKPIGVDCYNFCETGDVGRTMATASGGLNEHIPCVMVDSIPIDSHLQDTRMNLSPDIVPTLSATMGMGGNNGPLLAEPLAIDNHPNDSRMEVCEDGVIPTLSARMGTGGNNGPMLAEPIPYRKSRRAKDPDDYTTWVEAEVANTMNTFDLGETRCSELVAEPITYGFDPGADRDAGVHIHENLANTIVNGTCPGHHNGVCCPSYSVELGAASRLGGYWNEEVAPTLRATPGDNLPTVVTAGFISENGSKARSIGYAEEQSPTLKAEGVPTVMCVATQQGNAEICEDLCPTITASAGMSGNNQPYICAEEPIAYNFDAYDSNAMKSGNPHSGFHETEVSKCLDASGPDPSKHQGGTAIVEPMTFTTGDFMQIDEGKASTLMCRDYKDPQCVMLWNGEQVAPTLTARNAGGAQRMPDKDNFNCILEPKKVDYVIRRLTPTECERLQGFSDGWTLIHWKDDKGNTRTASDAARYKALGNSIAVPCADYIMRGVAKLGCKTLGSLFDGISAFPVAAYMNGIDTRWTAEIEDFPVQVEKIHFGDIDSDVEGDIDTYESK